MVPAMLPSIPIDGMRAPPTQGNTMAPAEPDAMIRLLLIPALAENLPAARARSFGKIGPALASSVPERCARPGRLGPNREMVTPGMNMVANLAKIPLRARSEGRRVVAWLIGFVLDTA